MIIIEVMLFVSLLIVLTVVFNSVNEWFQDNKDINIIPASLIETVAVFIFIFNYEREGTKEIIWVWVAIAIILVITIFNLIRYGIKDGLLVSIVELIFSIPAAILIGLILLASGDGKKNKKRKK